MYFDIVWLCILLEIIDCLLKFCDDSELEIEIG